MRRRGHQAACLLAIVGLAAGAAFASSFNGPAVAARQRPETVAPPTFARDIAPIVYKHCVSCHRPDGPAPFSLTTYQDVRGRARQVVSAVTRRLMPPWKPEPGFGEFAGVRRLTDDQIAVFQRWLNGGTPAGDLDDVPEIPRSNSPWQLGTPDLVVKVPQAYRVGPNEPDRLRNFVIPVRLPAARYVKAWEFRTDNLRVVHHAMVLVDATNASQLRDSDDPDSGFDGLVPLSAVPPEGYFVDWTPGLTPSFVSESMAWTLEANSDLVLVLHLRPTNVWETVDASIGLYFSDTPPTRKPAMIRLNRGDIDIPAGEPRYTIRDSYVLPVDVEVHGVHPHAHNLAKEVKAVATLPDGTARWLIYIRNWEFHWQDSYRYAAPVPLPAGTRISMEFTYDNSAANPANPHKPPQRVTFGQRTSNEMGDLWIQVIPRSPSDLPILNRSLRAKVLPQEIKGYEMMVNADPANVALRDELAALLTEAGAFGAAARHLTESLRLRPDAARSHYNLGYALLALGNHETAEGHFRTALTLDPEYARARYALGLALWAGRKHDEAIRHFADSVRQSPSSADAHYNLGVVLHRKGDIDGAMKAYTTAAQLDPQYADAHFAVGLVHAGRAELPQAVASFRRALATRADWPAAQIQLAWLLATAPDLAVRNPNEALPVAERAAALTLHQDAGALDALAAAFAASGRFDRAVLTAEKALALLSPSGDSDVAKGIRHRLSLYRGRTPYVDRR